MLTLLFSFILIILKEPREYNPFKSIHSPKTTIRPPGKTDYYLSDTDIEMQAIDTRLTQVFHLN